MGMNQEPILNTFAVYSSLKETVRTIEEVAKPLGFGVHAKNHQVLF